MVGRSEIPRIEFQWSDDQRDQIGLFLKSLGNKFSLKKAQAFGDFWS